MSDVFVDQDYNPTSESDLRILPSSIRPSYQVTHFYGPSWWNRIYPLSLHCIVIVQGQRKRYLVCWMYVVDLINEDPCITKRFHFQAYQNKTSLVSESLICTFRPLVRSMDLQWECYFRTHPLLPSFYQTTYSWQYGRIEFWILHWQSFLVSHPG